MDQRRRERHGGGGHRTKRRSRTMSPVSSRLRHPASGRRSDDRYPRSSRSRKRSPNGRRRAGSRTTRSRSRRHSLESRSRSWSPQLRASNHGRRRSGRLGRRDSSYHRGQLTSKSTSRSLVRSQRSRRRGGGGGGGGHKKQSRRKRHEEEALEKDGSDDSATHDDTIGSFEGRPGDYIDSRYKIIREAGLGTFGRVLECLDKQRDMVVAIKVVRKVDKYTESAKIEANILQDVNDKDEHNDSLCVRMYKWFEYRGHVCMVFERLGCSLYDYLKNHDYKPFPVRCIRAYAWQLLTSLEFIHSIKLIHTDLKPENILLVDDEEERSRSRSPSSSSSSDGGSHGSRSTRRHERVPVDIGDPNRLTLRPPACDAVKLIDFGGATYDDESKSSIINTRQYRSPEVILGLGWSYPSDIWSAGCIIAELYLGELLFGTHDNTEHLALIERCIGPLPDSMVQAAEKDPQSAKFFRRGRLNWPANAANEESVDHVRRMRKLANLLTPLDAASGLLDLLQLMLILDPMDRITAREARNHHFFDGFARSSFASGS